MTIVEESPARGRVRVRRSPLRFIPMFSILLIVYVGMKILNIDMRGNVFMLDEFTVTWVELFILAASFVGMIEIAKVAYPGVSNFWETVLIGGMMLLYFVLFVLGIFRADIFGMFRNTEFLMMTLICFVAGVMALYINNLTRGKTIIDERD